MSTHPNTVGHVPPLLRELARLALDQGWRIETSSGGHLRWISPQPDIEVEITSCTINERQILKTITHRLARKGLITNKAEWKRIEKRKRLIENRRLEIFSPERIREHGFFVGIDDTDNLISGAAVKDTPLGDEMLRHVGTALAEYAIDHGPTAVFDPALLPTACRRCGKEYGYYGESWIQLYAHEETCVGIPNEDEIDSFADDLADAVEKQGTDSCPACTEPLFLSEMSDHLWMEHHVVACNTCSKLVDLDEIADHCIAHEEERNAQKESESSIEPQELEPAMSSAEPTTESVPAPRVDHNRTAEDKHLQAILEMLMDNKYYLVDSEFFDVVEEWKEVSRRLYRLAK